MRRTRPLETSVLDVGDDATVVAPTASEVLRVTAFLVVQRNVLCDYLEYRDRDGVSVLFRLAIERARENADQAARAEVAKRVGDAVDQSGLAKAEFATRVGTSGSRLSTYLSGKVSPSAAMLVRIEAVGETQTLLIDSTDS